MFNRGVTPILMIRSNTVGLIKITEGPILGWMENDFLSGLRNGPNILYYYLRESKNNSLPSFVIIFSDTCVLGTERNEKN